MVDDTPRLFGILPYELRAPTCERTASRLYHPGGPLFPPKAFGIGWSLNFAHPGAWVLITLLAVTLMHS